MMPEAAQHSRSDSGMDPATWGNVLADAYRAIGERTMRELPIYNEALGVEAIGFRHVGGEVVGILVTPWFMNVVTPADRGASASLAPGSKLRLHLPAGEIDCTVGEVAPVGRIASCSLFSPMSDFADMASARAVAEAALAELLKPAEDQPAAGGGQGTTSSIDRRSFLRGALTERRG